MGPTGKNGTSGWNPGVGRITSLAFENTNHFIVGSPKGEVSGQRLWILLHSVLTTKL
jgi:hypothetical protein